MKLHVKLDIAGKSVNEVLSGTNADDIVGQAKARVARELGWKGLFLNAMTPLGFAQEAVRRINEAQKSRHAIPKSTEEFLALGRNLGYVTELLEE